ncbi:MAG: hypothetical protein JO331_08890 [Verrucomicrobia bacterium]|nr:hypothetical protein [Verrucomicrobiota bacterium]
MKRTARVCPEVIVDTLNVWDEKQFDQEPIGAKYKGINKQAMNEAEQKVWDRIQELVARFKRADRLVIGVPEPALGSRSKTDFRFTFSTPGLVRL